MKGSRHTLPLRTSLAPSPRERSKSLCFHLENTLTSADTVFPGGTRDAVVIRSSRHVSMPCQGTYSISLPHLTPPPPVDQNRIDQNHLFSLRCLRPAGSGLSWQTSLNGIGSVKGRQLPKLWTEIRHLGTFYVYRMEQQLMQLTWLKCTLGRCR